jgi:CRISPR-associated protein Csx10
MQRIKYKVTTLSPVLLTTNIGDINTVNTSEFITGTSIRGIFAGEFIKKNNEKPAHLYDNFYRWFLTGNIKFTPAYVVNKKNGQIYFPAPLSIQHKKNEENDYYDLLYKDIESPKYKADFIKIKNTDMETFKVNKSLNFHHARDPETGISKEGQIFNYESIDPGQTFQGNIIGEEKDLVEFTNTFNSEMIAYIGRSKNAQYGKIKIEFTTEPELFISEIEAIDFDFDEEEVSMTLLSDLIIYNENGFSTTNLNELEKYLGVKIEKAFIRSGEVENFVSIWKLRTPSEVSFRAGSAFLIKVGKDNKEKLIRLQAEGLGERRQEGFGRVVFCWQKEEEYRRSGYGKKQENIKKPDFPIPKLTSHIIQKLVKDLITKEVKVKAINEVDTFINYKRLPSKSLISRLESMIINYSKDNSKNPIKKDFREKLGKLRKTAKDKLEKCRNNNKTLLNFLKELDIDINYFVRKISDTEVLAEKINYIPANDIEFQGKVYQDYLVTFFSIMRKKLKKEKGEV